MKLPISCETWNTKLNKTPSCAPSGIILLSSLTTGTSLAPQLLFREKLKKQTQSLILPDQRTGQTSVRNQMLTGTAWWRKCLLCDDYLGATSAIAMLQLAELMLDVVPGTPEAQS